MTIPEGYELMAVSLGLLVAILIAQRFVHKYRYRGDEPQSADGEEQKA